MRIEFDYIRFRNFFSFGSRWQEVEFKKGVNLILGLDVERDRSNGSGKSSFLETIPFALFGKVNRNVTKDQIVNWKSRKNCEVEMGFTKGNETYTVYRGLKPDKLIISKNGNDLPMDARKLDFQKSFENDILGMDHKTFMSLIYTNINSTVPILTMSKPNKRQFLERVFGLEFIQDINSKSNEKLRNIEKKLSELSVQKVYNNKSKKEAQAQVAELTKKLKMLKTSLPLLNELKEQEKEFADLIQDAEDEYKEKNMKCAKLEGDIEYQNFIASRIGSKVEVMKSRVRTLGQQIEEIGSVERDLSQLEVLQKQLDGYVKLETINDNIESKQAEHEALVEKREKVVDRIREVETEKHSINTLVNQDLASARSIEEGSVCPTCGQKVKGAQTLQKIYANIEENKKKIDKLDEKANLFRMKLGDIEKKDDIKRQAIIRWRKDKDEVMKLQSDINSLLHSQAQKYRKEKLKKDIKRYRNVQRKLEISMRKVIEEAESIGRKAAILSEDTAKAKNIIDKYNNVVSEIERLEEKLNLEQTHKDELKSMLNKAKSKIAEARVSNQDIENEEKKLLHLTDYMQYIRLVCKDENLKQYVISANMPYLNQQTNEYLSDVGTGFYVSLDKWLDLDIKGPGIRGASYGNLSGGEARGIDLSLQMAFLDFARVKAGVFPDILELDELLDSSVDSYGLEKIMQIVRAKQRKDNLKIYLVSHRKEVNDVSVDRTYMIEKVNGYSNVFLQ
jgi:DNA repair exonuclease SbcCD ATPase subunit